MTVSLSTTAVSTFRNGGITPALTQYTDSFVGRTVASGGFGTASDGTAWTSQTNGSFLSVGSNEGTVSPGGATVATMGSNIQDVELLVRFKDGDGSSYLSMFARRSSSTTYYWLRMYRSGVINIYKVVAGVTTSIYSSAAVLSSSLPSWTRWRIAGNVISLKWWTDGSTEPATWNTSFVDSAVTATGVVGLGGFANTAVTVLVDTFIVSRLAVLSIITEGIEKSYTKAALNTRARSRDYIKTQLTDSMIDKSYVKAVLDTRARQVFKIKAVQVTRAIARSSIRVSMLTGSRSRFYTSMRLATRLRSRFIISLRLKTVMRSRSLIQVTARIYQLVFCSIRKVQPADYIGAITPNTTVVSQATLELQTMAPVTTLTAASVLVEFPDNTTSTYTLLNGDIVYVGSGVWQFGYNTKGEGGYRETWTVTATTGDVSQFQSTYTVKR